MKQSSEDLGMWVFTIFGIPALIMTCFWIFGYLGFKFF